MPFIIRKVEPEYLCQTEKIISGTNVLESQNNQTWINFLRQMSSISGHSSDIFNNLISKITDLQSRSDLLNTRIKDISSQLSTLKFPITEASTDEGYTPCPYVIQPKIVSQSLALSEMPSALLELYNSCNKLPDFHLLDKYRTDNIKTASLYSDPTFFNREWTSAAKRDLEMRRKRNMISKQAKQSDTKNLDLPKCKEKEIAQKHTKVSIVSPASLSTINVTSTLPPLPPGGPLDYSSTIQKNDRFNSGMIQPTSALPQPHSYRPPLPPKSDLPQIPTGSPPLPPPDYPPPAPRSKSFVSQSSLKLPPSFSMAPPPPSELPPPPPPSNQSSMPPPPLTMPPPPPPSFIPPPPAFKPAPADSSSNAVSSPQEEGSFDVLLSSIRSGKSLKKVEPPPIKKVVEEVDDVAALLEQRMKVMRPSDSEDDDDGCFDDWE